jgi:hypothetical protein
MGMAADGQLRLSDASGCYMGVEMVVVARCLLRG